MSCLPIIKTATHLCIKFLLAADFPISLVRTPNINDKSISTSY